MILREAVVSNIIKYLFLLISYNNEIYKNENLINKIRKDEKYNNNLTSGGLMYKNLMGSFIN